MNNNTILIDFNVFYFAETIRGSTVEIILVVIWSMRDSAFLVPTP